MLPCSAEGPPLATGGNRPTVLGAVLLALTSLYALLNGAPWDR